MSNSYTLAGIVGGTMPKRREENHYEKPIDKSFLDDCSFLPFLGGFV
jgi:hypothetical protein